MAIINRSNGKAEKMETPTIEKCASDNRSAITSGPCNRHIYRALKAGWPILIALVPLALVLGAQASRRGLTVAEVGLMTALNYAGGSEFAAVGLWSTPIPVGLIVGMTFLVNSRYLLMGAALAPHLKHLPRWIVYPALFFMVDESWALGLADARQNRTDDGKSHFSLAYYVTLGVMLWLPWFIFSMAGAIVGPVVGDLGRLGLDMVFPAIFLVLVRGMWTTARAARPWLVSLVVAAATHLLVPGPWYVPAGALAGLAAAWLLAERQG